VRRRRALLAAFAAAALAAAALVAGCAGGPLGARRTLLPPGGALLPSRLRDGLFLLRARFRDERDHWLLLDTGTDRALLDYALCRELDLQPGGPTTIVAANGAQVGGRRLSPLPVLRLGDLELQDVDAAAIDLQQLREHAGLPIEGIAGTDLFRGCLLQIDLPARTVRALPAGAAPPSPSFAFPGRVPAVAAQLAGRPLTALVDTGFQGLLAVPREFAVEWRTPPRRGGELATLDGVSGHDTGRAAGAFVVGEQRFEEPWVMVADGAPKLGMGALGRSVLTLDAGAGRLWITPSALPAPRRRGR